MKKLFVLLLLSSVITAWPSSKADAQIEVIQEIIKRAIMAIDLGVQRVQEQTIKLQAVQKELENAMQKLHLDDITNWVQKQKDLYQEYYTELWQIKNAITYYQRVKDMIEKQAHLVGDYKRAYALVRQDNHFNADEVSHIYKVYDGILAQSIKNIDQIEMVINAFVTQMNDADRLRIIDEADRRIDENYNDLKQFTQENILISLQRSKDQSEINSVKMLYGIP